MSKAISTINIKEIDQKTIDEVHTIFSLLIDLSAIMNDDREKGIELYDMAKTNYDEIKQKVEEDDLPSDEAVVERELNLAISQMTEAYKALLSSSEKIPKVMEVIAKLGVAKYKGEVLIQIAGGGNQEIDINDADDKMKLLRDARRKEAIANKFMGSD